MRDFSKVACSVWQSRRFSTLSEAGKLAYLYLLTCPAGNSIGCFRIPHSYARIDLGYTQARLEKTLSEVADTGLIDVSDGYETCRIDLFLQHQPICNTKHASGAASAALALEDGPLKARVINDILLQRFRPPEGIRHELETAMKRISNQSDTCIVGVLQGEGDKKEPIHGG